jgi:hypothetical protein
MMEGMPPQLPPGMIPGAPIQGPAPQVGVNPAASLQGLPPEILQALLGAQQ